MPPCTVLLYDMMQELIESLLHVVSMYLVQMSCDWTCSSHNVTVLLLPLVLFFHKMVFTGKIQISTYNKVTSCE